MHVCIPLLLQALARVQRRLVIKVSIIWCYWPATGIFHVKRMVLGYIFSKFSTTNARFYGFSRWNVKQHITCNIIRWSFVPKKKTQFLLFHHCVLLCSLNWLCTHCNCYNWNFEYYLKLLIMVFTTKQIISVLSFLLEVVLSIDPKTKDPNYHVATSTQMTIKKDDGTIV